MRKDIILVSNELEFCLDGTEAAHFVGNGLPVVHEVNRRDVAELNVSLAGDVARLNATMRHYVSALAEAVRRKGGALYGGSSLLCDVSDVEPARYRTTSLSESCARGFLDITSQQVILGVNDEALGIELHNYFRGIAPALIALTASSPFAYGNRSGCNLNDTQCASRRAEQYESMCRFFPNSMWRDVPTLASLSDYQEHVQVVSDEINRRLGSGVLDANWHELMLPRNGSSGTTFSYFPFSTLDPHQIYWTVRPRPDHAIESRGCPFSVEIRTPDMPTTVERMQMLNALVAGLAYGLADGIAEMPFNGDGGFEDIKTAARYGLDARISGRGVRGELYRLAQQARRSLERRGYEKESRRLDLAENVLKNGNDADLIRRWQPQNPEELRGYLAARLAAGEGLCY